MKKFIAAIFLGVAIGQPALAENNPELSKVTKIECERTTKAGDHQTLIPNFGDADHIFFTGYYTTSSGRFERKRIVYEVKTERVPDGADHLRISNPHLQFQDDRTYDLRTNDYVTGTLSRVVCQPGVGGYGPGGIPEATCVDMIYNCQFIR